MIRIGQKFQVNGVELIVHALNGSEYEIWSVNSYGVWFATEAELLAHL